MDQSKVIDNGVLIFRKMMANCVQGANKDALSELFEQAERATNNQQEQQLFEDYRGLKSNGEALVRKVDSLCEEMPEAISSELKQADEVVALSLIDEEDLEITLAFTQLDTVLEVATHAQLYALEKRLKVIYASRNFDKSNMPFSPASISWIMSRAFEPILISVNVKVRLVEKMTKLLTKDLNEAYSQINKLFIDAGILPNIKPETLKKKPSQGEINKEAAKPENLQEQQAVDQSLADNVYPMHSGGPNTPQGPASEGPQYTGPQGGQDDPGILDSKQLIGSLFDMLSSGYQQGSGSATSQPSTANNANRVENSAVDEALGVLGKQTSVNASSRHIEQFKEQIVDEIRNQTGVYYPEFNQRQTKSMDVMGLVYDEIRKDNNIDSHIVSSLNAINIPLLRLAVSDENFFTDHGHPARRYLETLITASQQWHGSPVVKKIHQYSEAVSRQFDGSTESFEKAITNLQDYLSITANRVKKAEEKWVSAAKGQEKLEYTKKVVANTLEDLAKDCEVSFIKDVLKNVWEDSLTLTMLREGDDSEAWNSKMEAAKSLAAIGNKEKYQNLESRNKIEAIRQMDMTMDEMGFSKRDRDKAKENVMNVVEWAEDEKKQAPKTKKILSIEKAKEETSNKSENKKIEEIRDLTDAEREVLAKIKLKPYGSLFDFYVNQQREKSRHKLCWISTMSERALFLDLLGKNPNKMGLSRLVIDLERGNIKEVEVDKGGYFQKTLKKILERLKSASK
ncbi:DUF1631 family protein [Marinicella sp. W31]|uniref:DUF1631 family protein n=1 Tax=Marinicella sp. W31 TaxID=3023713 RepID=UPI003757510B